MPILNWVVTAKTFFKNFSVPCLWIAGAAFVLGGALSGYGSFKITRAFYQGEALEAKLNLSKFETALEKSKSELLERASTAANTALENRNADQTKLDSIVADVRSLGRRVQQCATKSDVRVTVTPSGAIETVPGEQQRDLAEAIREFAEACADQRDKDANDHNALMDWLQDVTKKPASH